VDGLVNTLCGHFDGCEPNTLRRIKAYLDTLASTPTAQAEALSVSVSRQAFESPEAEEGRRAFRERRPPAWAN
jgi:enoyl-CoA hydratase/carnithine racemase